MKIKIGIIGYGKLGSVIAVRLLTSKLFNKDQINICRKNTENTNSSYNFCSSINEVISDSTIILLAVKPQDTQEVCNQLYGKVTKDQAIISVVTGKSLSYLQTHTGAENIIRCSTNLLLENGKAFSFWSGSAKLMSNTSNAGLLAQCCFLLESWGENRMCENEADLETAIVDSGSMIGLINVVIEAFVVSMILRGRNPDEAVRLALSQISAITELALQKGFTPEQIAKQVRTPGGITNAACEVYDKQNLKEIIHQGNLAADKRVSELS